MRYFDHDTTASMDDKILALRLEHGGEAVDVYWTLLEKMYNEEAPINLAETNAETKALTVRLAIGLEVIKKYVSYMISIGLFEASENDENLIFSRRALENIKAYQEKCETARQNGKKGGRKPKAKPTQKPNANQTLTDSKAGAKLRKEKKGIGFDKQNQIPTDSGGGAENRAPLSAFAAKALAEQQAQRNAQAELEAQAIPCTVDIKAIFDEVDKVG